jgi:hypothetical protein
VITVHGGTIMGEVVRAESVPLFVLILSRALLLVG